MINKLNILSSFWNEILCWCVTFCFLDNADNNDDDNDNSFDFDFDNNDFFLITPGIVDIQYGTWYGYSRYWLYSEAACTVVCIKKTY